MQEKDTFPARQIFLLPLVAGAFLVSIWAFHVVAAAKGYSLFRDQHLGGAVEFAKNGIDLLRPVIPGFTATGTPTPLEIPVWQATAAFGLRLAGGWWGAANITSLVYFTSALLPLFLVARRELGRRGAWWTLICFLATPLVFWQAGVASTDMFSLVTAIWFIYFADRLIEAPTVWNFLVCAIAAIFAALSKIPFFMEVGMAAAFVLFIRHGLAWNRWAALAGIGILSLAAAVIWSRHIDAMVATAEFQYRGVTLKQIPSFYFGDLAYRLSPITYIRAGWIALGALWGSFFLILVSVYGLVRNFKGWGAGMLVGFAVTALIFFKVVTTHKHYYLMLTPAVAMLTAAGIEGLLAKLKSGVGREAIVTCLIAAGLALAVVQGLMALEVPQNLDPFANRFASTIASHTTPASRLLIANGGWGGDMLVRSGRQGLSIDSTSVLADPARKKRLAELGYDTFVALSESPLLDAVQRTNPGAFTRKRQTWESATSPVDANWPVIYADENLVIKKIEWEK